MHHLIGSVVRGRLLRQTASLLAAVLLFTHTPVEAADHFPFGPLSAPRQIPAWTVTLSDGSPATTLAKLLRGHVTALQLMFTSCNATCPLQGAAFASAQRQLGSQIPDAQFVSLSIDPATDSPAAMRQWLNTFRAGVGWRGATPRAEDVTHVFRVLGDGGMSPPEGVDPHSGQVYIVNRDGMLVYRTASMPSSREIVEVMRRATTTGWE